jgi:hypothetical protein
LNPAALDNKIDAIIEEKRKKRLEEEEKVKKPCSLLKMPSSAGWGNSTKQW